MSSRAFGYCRQGSSESFGRHALLYFFVLCHTLYIILYRNSPNGFSKSRVLILILSLLHTINLHSARFFIAARSIRLRHFVFEDYVNWQQKYCFFLI